MSPLTYITDENVILNPQQIQTRRAGLFHEAEYAPDGAIISGSFNNSATLAKFKDIEIRISFYSVTETLIAKENYVIYEYLEPHSTVSFSFKITSLPQAYNTFSCEVIGATAVSN